MNQRSISAAALLFSTLVLAGPALKAKATEAFRKDHAQIRVHLEHVRDWTGRLAEEKPEDQKKTAQKVVDFFEKHIKPHAEWEERFLYPLVDRLAGGGQHRFTSSMRFEHTLVGRWVEQLGKEASKPTPNYRAFVRRTDNLIGLVDAHFEEEEQVLLPLIDQSMSPEEFQKAMGPAAAHP